MMNNLFPSANLLRKIFFLCFNVLFVFLAPMSCVIPTETHKDCICTAEFVMITVTIVNSKGQAVDSVRTQTNRVKTGKVISETTPAYPPGRYAVLTDGNLSQVTQNPELYLFKAEKGSAHADAEFLVNKDDCSCHVHKLAGPDTLILTEL